MDTVPASTVRAVARPVRGLATATMITFLVQAAVALVLLFTTNRYNALTSQAYSLTASEAIFVLGVVGLLVAYFLSLTASAILFLVWVHRAYSNLPALGWLNPRYTPGWVVGYFFIPIVSLYIPYQAVSELWKGSETGAGGGVVVAPRHMPSSFVALWWFCFLLHNVYNLVSYRLDSSAVTMVGYGIEIVGIAVTIVLVRTITRFQEEKLRLPWREATPF